MRKNVSLLLVPLFFFLSSDVRSGGKSELFSQVDSLGGGKVVTDAVSLRRAASDALKYFRGKRSIVRSSILGKVGLSSAVAKRTLKKIIKIIDEDAGKSKQRILDPKFLEKNFSFIRWNGDAEAAKKAGVVIPPGPDAGELRDGKVRITSYAVFSVNGGYERSSKFDTPLYAIVKPKDAGKNGKVVQDVDSKSHSLKPLVWLSEADSDDALMQGSVVVTMPEGKRRVFNVHRRIALKPVPGSDTLGFWVFKEVHDVDGKNGGPHLRIMNHGGALFAGDLRNLGLGKLIAIRYKNPMSRKYEIRLGVLADSGEAFKNNLYQLDLYAGIFKSKASFRKYIKTIANTAHAYLLVAR